MHTYFNAAVARFRAPKLTVVFSWALLFCIWGSLAQAAGTVTSDSNLSIRWTYTSGGNSCSGFPAKIGRVYSVMTPGPTPTPYPGCCPYPGDSNSCYSAGGYGTGTPNPSSCTGGSGGGTPAPPPGSFDFSFYGTAGGYTNYTSSSYNGATYGFSAYGIVAGSSFSDLRAVIGFDNNKPASCPGLSGGYCYTGHVHSLNFSTADADCGKWIATTVSDCAFSVLKIEAKFEPSSGCPAGSTATPTPTPTPVPSCNFDQGGTGRVCTADADCCSGHCAVAGRQPFMTSANCAAGDASCIVGPKFLSGFSGGGKDSYVAGGVTPSGGIAKISPVKVCVPSALPASYSDFVVPPSTVPAANLNAKLILNDGSYLHCYLQGNDLNRMSGNSCACKSGYEAVVLKKTDYDIYNVANDRRKRLDVMWAQIVDLLKSQPKVGRRVVDRLSDIIPQAGACTAPPMGGPVNASLDCPSDHNTTGAVSNCCCTYTWQDAGYISRDACVCNQYPNSSSCSSPGGGGPVVDDSGCDASSVATSTMNIECNYNCVPLGSSTLTSCSSLKTSGSCGGGNSACSGCHAASMTSCSFVPVGGTSGGGTSGGTTGTPPGVVADVYTDESSPQWRTTISQGYGTGTSSDESANALIAKGAGYVLGCVKKCDGTTSGRDPADPTKCSCPAGSTWDQANYTCKTCYEGAILDAGGNCTCPTGYIDASLIGGPQKCRPAAPTAEYIQDGTSDWYPVCGANRVPMKYDLTSSTFAGPGRPATQRVATIGTVDYPYASPAPIASPYPIYYYSDFLHCGCGKGNPETPAATAATDPVASTWSKGDFASLITPRDSAGRPKFQYGPVAIAKDGTSDGRDGVSYRGSQSVCGCPNVNETISSDGTTCEAMVDKTDIHIRFAKFDPELDEALNNVLPGQIDVRNSGKIVSTIKLPPSASSTAATTLYNRGIWKCDVGYTLTGSPAKCVFDKSKHMCDATSAVSSSVGGASPAAQFANARNKKLACCMNGFGGMGATGSTVTKFDCIENMNNQYADFNALWASSDAADDGGQMNAFVLADGRGKPITGFYTENGVRCGEFNEFTSTAIQPGRINPIMSSGQMNRVNGSADAFESVGSAIPNPSGSGFNFMVSKLGSAAKAPTSTADRRRCPILVRAALMVGCPKNPASENAALKTFEDKTTDPVSRRCSVAGSVQVKVRVEQVWEIAGQPKLQPVDTVIDNKAAGSISVDRIIQKKFGNQCPTGTKRQGDACVYLSN